MSGPMSDRRIKELCQGKNPMIEPFVDTNIRKLVDLPIISYGVSSYGYDMRVAGEFKIFTNLHTAIIDPKNFDAVGCHEINLKDDGSPDFIIIPPNSFALARSVEYWRIPDNVVGIVLGKSTYARCGLIANITALEPGWCGHLTIELSNSTPLPMKVYAWEGIAQAILFEADERCETSYADKKGKYQAQTGITTPKV